MQESRSLTRSPDTPYPNLYSYSPTQIPLTHTLSYPLLGVFS